MFGVPCAGTHTRARALRRCFARPPSRARCVAVCTRATRHTQLEALRPRAATAARRVCMTSSLGSHVPQKSASAESALRRRFLASQSALDTTTPTAQWRVGPCLCMTTICRAWVRLGVTMTTGRRPSGWSQPSAAVSCPWSLHLCCAHCQDRVSGSSLCVDRV